MKYFDMKDSGNHQTIIHFFLFFFIFKKKKMFAWKMKRNVVWCRYTRKQLSHLFFNEWRNLIRLRHGCCMSGFFFFFLNQFKQGCCLWRNKQMPSSFGVCGTKTKKTLVCVCWLIDNQTIHLIKQTGALSSYVAKEVRLPLSLFFLRCFYFKLELKLTFKETYNRSRSNSCKIN